ncbi:hypothetical protein Pen02_79990 [Plantactinospora endophytica]|uniref:NACHT domain-containing protein n=1 Tax=Plantactinospora endophytica TaxID=673535 RepID=A0ABQ4EEB4_9ACTN|nr:hypothetical protein Pen02_79990 [Plantactinospora endophytica]
MWRWGRRVRRFGWVLFGTAALVVSTVVLVRGLHADLAVARLSGPGSGPAELAAAKDAFERWTNWANIVAAPLAAAALSVIAAEKLARSRAAVSDGGALVGELAASVLHTVRHELVYRHAGRPAPVMVRWSATGRPAAGWDAVLGDGTLGPGLPLVLDGDAGEIVTRFRELPNRQLVILGAPGAGKSVLAMLLAAGLLERASDEQRVPVLIAINDWQARSVPLDRFLRCGLVRGHHRVLAEFGDPDRVARWLFAQHRILPVLDGLDELPAAERSDAVRQLDEYGLRGHHLVVTSRGVEYEDAVRSGGTILTKAAVVEIEPVEAGTAIAYLSYPELRTRLWEPVFREMRSNPDAPVSRTLTSPLMIALARSAYEREPHQPGELLAFTTPEAVARRLMDVFVTAAYEAPGALPPDRARRYLSTLAYHMYERGTRDLNLWDVRPTLLAGRPWIIRASLELVSALTAIASLATPLADPMLRGEVIPWVRFRATHLRLVCAGRLPLRLARFLDDAHRKRAVLRRNGPTYQFRHVLLQDHLALRQALEYTRERVQRGEKAAAERLAALLITLGRGDEAIEVLRRQWEAGNHYVAGRLAGLWAGQGRTEEALAILRAAAAGDHGSARRGREQLARLLAEHDRVDELRTRADVGDEASAAALTEYLVRTGELDEAVTRALRRGGCGQQLIERLISDGRHDDVRAIAETGQILAIEQRLSHLVGNAQVVEAEAWVETLTRQKDYAAERLDALLLEHGHDEAALRRARRTYDQGTDGSAVWLAAVLSRQGDTEAAVALLRNEPGESAAARLAEILVDSGRFSDALTVMTDRPTAGSVSVAARLVDYLVARSRAGDAIALLRARAATGRQAAIDQLVRLLLEQRELLAALQVVRAESPAAHSSSRHAVVTALVERGRVKQAMRLLRQADTAGNRSCGPEMVQMLARAGLQRQLIARASAGDGAAEAWWIDQMVGAGLATEAIALMQERVSEDDPGPPFPLADLLARHGRLDEATALIRRHADAGNTDARAWLDAAEHGKSVS